MQDAAAIRAAIVYRWSLVLALGLAPARASADGAFPDSSQLLLPADRPNEIVLATNFGLVMSEDDGASWSLVCEPAIGAFVSLYQLGADDTLYADDVTGLLTSSDGGCTWTRAAGGVAGGAVPDAFPDPSDARHVLAIATPAGDGGAEAPAVFESRDRGLTFAAPPLYSPPLPTLALTGVEIARSSPSDVYLTLYSYQAHSPFIAHSANGGAGFDVADESAAIHAPMRLAAVDANDPQTLYLRVQYDSGDALAISHDAGATVALALEVMGPMSAFLQRASGTLLVGTILGPSYRSNATANASGFEVWPNAPHVRALAERGGQVYVAADNYQDGFALARSSDEGAHWQPLLSFSDIQGPKACATPLSVCVAQWPALAAVLGARAEPAPSPPSVMAPDLGAAPPPETPGCGCRLAPVTARESLWGPMLFAFTALWLLRKRRRS